MAHTIPEWLSQDSVHYLRVTHYVIPLTHYSQDDRLTAVENKLEKEAVGIEDVATKE